MKLHEHPGVRGTAYVLGLLVWLVCVAGMGILAAGWIEIATEPPHENKLAGIIWVFFGPSLPVGLAVAGALLYAGWNQYTETSQTWANVAAGTLPAVGVTYVLGFLVPFTLVTAIAMGIALAGHVLATFGLIGATLWKGRAPWISSDGDSGADPSASTRDRAVVSDPGLRAGFFVVGALVWMVLAAASGLTAAGHLIEALREHSTSDLTGIGILFAGTSSLLAAVSYGMLAFCSHAVDGASERIARVARGSSVALFLVGVTTALFVLHWLPLPAVILEISVFLLHVGSLVAAFVHATREVGVPWTLDPHSEPNAAKT